jgi:hypothetical protein
VQAEVEYNVIGDVTHVMIMSGAPLILPSYLIDQLKEEWLERILTQFDAVGTFEGMDLEDDMADGWSVNGKTGNHINERNAWVEWLQTVSPHMALQSCSLCWPPS